MSKASKLSTVWARFWLRFAGTNPLARMAMGLAAWPWPPYFGRYHLANIRKNGFYISPKATIHHKTLQLGPNVFIDDGVIIFQDHGGGSVELSQGVHLHREVIAQTGHGGCVAIGERTHVQPRCVFSAYVGQIRVGSFGEIAPHCAFYSYDHGYALNQRIRRQPLTSKGGIVIEDDVWLGFGVIVLDGVTIGKGAVIGAGAVVTRDIPENTIAAGVPARVMKART